MADLIWRCSSTLLNNKQSHHEATAIVKAYRCVGQLHMSFKHFTILAFSASWLLLGKKNDKIWILLITHNQQCYVKSTSNRVSSPHYVETDQDFIGCNFGRCVMICYKLQRGASNVSLSQEARKGKNNHGQVRVKLLFIKSGDTFCHVLSNVCRLKATIFLLIIYVQIIF